MENRESIQKVKDYLQVININDSSQLLKKILEENESKIINKSYYRRTKEFLEQIERYISEISDDYNVSRDEESTDRAYNNLMIDLLTVTNQLQTLLEIENIISITPVFPEDNGNEIEIRINSNYDTFTDQDLTKVLSYISELLDLPVDKLIVNNVRKGSVVLTLELPSEEEAEKLFMLIKLGKLEGEGVSNAKLKGLSAKHNVDEQNENSERNIFVRVKEQIKNGNTGNALDYLDTYLEGRYPVYYNQLIIHKANYSKTANNLAIGLVTTDEFQVKENRIIMAILELTDKLIAMNKGEII